jgi:DNA-directed RNA polymerase subunit alpha
MPKTLTKDESTATDTYAKFTAEPFEAGYGHTVGNSLRRVLLSSLEGAAITAVKIAGAQHEFATLPSVVEDVTDIVLNLKRVKFKLDGQDHEPKKLSLNVNKEGEVTAGDIQTIQGFEVLNPKQLICTLDRKHKFDAELEVRVGRGFATGEENKRPDQPIGLIPIDSIFSPVTRVKYAVENTRVGQRTDYDKLILEIWTDGRLTPDDALLQASAIIRHHLDVFVHYNEEVIEFDQTPAGVSEENIKLKKLLNMSVNEIELSVRAANCLNNANITTVTMIVAIQPVRVMVEPSTRRPPTCIIGIVLGMISNQLFAWTTNATSSTRCSASDHGVRNAASQAFQAASPCPRRRTPTARITA